MPAHHAGVFLFTHVEEVVQAGGLQPLRLTRCKP
jgi:hypothetical protein